MSSLSVAIVSRAVGKSPEEIAFSFIFDEAYRLAQRGIKIHVIRSRIEKESLSYGIYFHGIERGFDLKAMGFILRNIPVHLPIAIVRKPPLLYMEHLYATNVLRVVEKNNIDIIHAHFAHSEGLVGLLVKRKMNKPLVVTVHGHDILVEPSVRYGARLSKRIDAIVKLVLKEADAVITASNATFIEACRIIGLADKIHLIPNGVDIQRFNTRIESSGVKKKLGIENCFVVFALRHHEPWYGLEYLIRAIPTVLKQRKDVFFVIGGSGSLRQYHEELVTKLGIGSKVIFTGRIPRKEVPKYYAMSDIVVVPSLQEAFGLVVSEAMACGKPVIGTRVGGILDQIIDGYNGFLVEPKNPAQIAEKILWLLENHNEAKRMGMNGRKIVEEKFNINERINKIHSLYEELKEC